MSFLWLYAAVLGVAVAAYLWRRSARQRLHASALADATAAGMAEPVFTDLLTLDLSTVEASLAGPKRPQDRVPLSKVAAAFTHLQSKQVPVRDVAAMQSEGGIQPEIANTPGVVPIEIDGHKHDLRHGDVVIAAITSCTNTSNPAVMLVGNDVPTLGAMTLDTYRRWITRSLDRA